MYLFVLMNLQMLDILTETYISEFITPKDG